MATANSTKKMAVEYMIGVRSPGGFVVSGTGGETRAVSGGCLQYSSSVTGYRVLYYINTMPYPRLHAGSRVQASRPRDSSSSESGKALKYIAAVAVGGRVDASR